MEKALEIADTLSFKVDPKDRKTLIRIADTAITGKSVESAKEKLDGIIVDAVMAITEKTDGKYTADEDDVLIKKQKGKSIDDSELVRGIILDKKRVSEGMPKKVTGAKIALIAMPLEITKTQVKAKIKITTADQVSAFSQQEQDSLKKLADSVIHREQMSCSARRVLQTRSSSSSQSTAYLQLKMFLKRISSMQRVHCMQILSTSQKT